MEIIGETSTGREVELPGTKYQIQIKDMIR